MTNTLQIDPMKLIILRGTMSQADLAKKAGVTRETVNEIENSVRKNITFNTFNGLLKALNVSRDMLLK